MKRFTDIFICRPVLAMVISLLIFILGLRALDSMQVRQFPELTNAVITIQTAYPGASAQLMEGFITSRIEQSIASAEGIDYVTSTSTQGASTITVYVRLGFDPNTAFTDIMSKVSAVEDDLPKQAQQPVITKQTGEQTDLMYIGFNSDTMTPEQITDYISRVVQPKLETVDGVAQAELLGDKVFAMRIWLNPKRMAALGVSAQEVNNALMANNFQSAAGGIKGDYIEVALNAKTDAEDVATFQNLVVKSVNGTLIHLRDVAKVELGAEDYDSSVYFNGKKAIFVGIAAAPTANPLSVIDGVRKALPNLMKVYPPALKSKVVYDATEYIRSSINEVVRTIFEATAIVIMVIFLSLGSLRSVIIPVITIPLSLVGMCFFMLLMGYSINLLTLLAMVLAIGMVVDDAIVVVENIHRHIEEGMTPFSASIKGAREIATAVISMTITLAAVYAPIGFMQGLTGALFTEFAFSLAGAVIISGIIALTLSPMMCSKLLEPGTKDNRFVKYIDHTSDKLKNWYSGKLTAVLNVRSTIVTLAVVVLCSCVYLFMNTHSELAPIEDQGAIFAGGNAPQYANINYTEAYTNLFNKIYNDFPAKEDTFIVNGAGDPASFFSAMILKPWDQRQQTQNEILPLLQQKMRNVAGLQTVAFPRAPLPGGGKGVPIQFVVSTILPFNQLYVASQKLLNAAQHSGMFLFVDNTLKFNKPELDININRAKAADLGLNMQDISVALATSLGGNYINRFSMYGKSYQVIPELKQRYRMTPQQLSSIYMPVGKDQTEVPITTVISAKVVSQPNSLTHFNQLNSTTIEGVMMPGKTMGQGLAFLSEQANKILPKGISYDYAGQSRQYMQEGMALIYTFFLSIVVIYLVLAAQFESFRDPLVVLISVPLSICGALIPLNLGLASINIYTQIGLITLIGLISKHGILMVEFANQLQAEEGLSVREAIVKAATIRLRPVLMTTASMVLGVLPLILSSGAGAVSRFDIGLVIASGMIVGTLFTLFVVPTMYTFIAKKHQPLKQAEEQ